ncbi:hypothetical protein ACHAXN_000899 [Cyclotella atomus]
MASYGLLRLDSMRSPSADASLPNKRANLSDITKLHPSFETTIPIWLQKDQESRLLLYCEFRICISHTIHPKSYPESSFNLFVSALIAEFTENVVALESEITSKEQQIQHLTDANQSLQSEMQDLKLKASTYTDELEVLISQIDKLVHDNAQLASQNKDLAAIQQNMQPLQLRNEQMEQIISSISSSLKDAKTSLAKQIKHSAMLEKEKLHSVEHQAKLRETHLRDIEAYKKRLDEAHQGQIQLRKEMDDLRTQLCAEQLKNTKLVSAQNNLQAATESIARLNAEKAVLCQEVATITAEKEKLAEEMEKRSAMADPVKVLKKELVRLRSKLADAQMENTELMGLQARLDETEKCLSTVLSEKNQLKAALGEQLSFELNESRSTDSSTSSTNQEWLVQKKSFERRVNESEQALVMLAKENEDLQSKIDSMQRENNQLQEQRDAEPTQDELQQKLMTELGALKMTYCKEKKMMMARQQELEGLLIEALQDKFGSESEEVVKVLKGARLEIKKNAVAE